MVFFYQETLEFETKKDDIKDITDLINGLIKKSKTNNGLINILTQHTTNSLYLNENEDFLYQDLKEFIQEKVPSDKNYMHDNIAQRDCPEDEPENAPAHIKAAFYGNASLQLPYADGKLDLGRYQRVLLAEFDGPCPRPGKTPRQVKITIMGLKPYNPEILK